MLLEKIYLECKSKCFSIFSENGDHFNDCYNQYSNYIHLINNVFIFINHSQWLGGASKFLHEIVLHYEINSTIDNILILDAGYGKLKEDCYYGLLKHKPLYYNNIEELYNLISFFKPICILVNSIGIFIKNLIFFEKFLSITVLYFHETLKMIKYIEENIIKYLQCIHKNTCILFTTKNVEKDFITTFKFTNTYVLTPFLTQKMIVELDSYDKPENFNQLEIDKSKITFIMSGTVEHRKGYDIFKNLSLLLPQFNFIWIGGKIINPYVNIITRENFFHISHILNPFYYYTYGDYFLLTSRDEPFGLVIIESLYLNLPCIVLENNIKYKHEESDYYISLQNHNNNPSIISDKLCSLQLQKRININSKSYIQENFCWNSKK